MTQGKRSKTSSAVYLSYLPDDLLLNCLSRVSRSYYSTVSLVCKRFHSLVTSLELPNNRALIGRSCLYLCFRLISEPEPCWFTLCQRPTGIPNPKSRWLTPCFIPKGSVEKKLNISHHAWSTRAVIGSNIDTSGECIDDDGFSSRVLFMDRRSHTWRLGPSMRTAQDFPLVSVLDGKIYVVEGSNNPSSSNLIEIFDPKTQIWKHVPSPRAEILGQSCTLRSLAIGGKLYLFGDKCMVYEPEEDKWDVVEESDMRWGLVDSVSSCVIDNVMYSSGMSRKLQWYDSVGRLWRDLNGFGGLPKSPKHGRGRVRLVNYGGKIAFLWEKKVNSTGSDEKKIWCAVIEVVKGKRTRGLWEA
ncbi:unnamed protein product [Microthlaspi erraticum]|uniref:F-box domain-containing protein n=1 Tax=Microthlaspi erraticum TaxID=1685480 RepID=A0A6D2HYQ2_9BRAS|nr:unnamed protein product [Microthlaspi erraticum]